MRILNLQISREMGLRIVENKDGGIDFVTFKVDGHYVNPKPGVPDLLVASIPYNRRIMVAEFINPHFVIEDQPSPKIERMV